MSNSRFWKVVAALHIVSLLYVGLGLRHAAPPASGPLPSGGFAAQAKAAAVQTLSTDDDRHLVCTASQDGKILYVWDASVFMTTYFRQDVRPIKRFVFDK